MWSWASCPFYSLINFLFHLCINKNKSPASWEVRGFIHLCLQTALRSEEGRRGYRSLKRVCSAWMIYDKVLFLVSLIIWHTCKAFSFSAKFLLLTLSNKAQPLPPMWYVNEWMWGHFDFGSVSIFVSAFFFVCEHLWRRALFGDHGAIGWQVIHLKWVLWLKFATLPHLYGTNMDFSPGMKLCFLLLPKR